MKRLYVWNLLLVAAVMAYDATAAHAAPGIPVGRADLGNTTLQSPKRLVATRFVLDKHTSIYRWWDNMDLGGADPPAVAHGTGYADGRGGLMRLRLTTVKADGTPNLRNVLGTETVNAVQRNNEVRYAYGISNPSDLAYFNVGGVRLRGNTMYAAVFDNVDPRPRANYYSKNFPLMNIAYGGPNAKNTLDANAPGAVAGLDPREVVLRSFDRGRTWRFARYGVASKTKNRDITMQVPWYGWQTCVLCAPESNQPYYSYGEHGAFAMIAHNSPRSVTLTRAGGYAPSGSKVGVVTVTNLTTGAASRTASLRTGIATGALARPVKIKTGDDFEIRNTGTVFKAECDTFIYRIFRLGMLDLSTGSWPFETRGGHNCDRAELFALPWPYHVRGQPRRKPRERIHARTAWVEADYPRWPPWSVWPPFDWPLRP